MLPLVGLRRADLVAKRDLKGLCLSLVVLRWWCCVVVDMVPEDAGGPALKRNGSVEARMKTKS